jgi:hypothetical protein
VVAEGPLDIIRMTEMSKFNEMSIVAADATNGAITTYTITFKAKTPLENGDIFNLLLPLTIKSPKTPICEKLECIDSISCTAERGKLIA